MNKFLTDFYKNTTEKYLIAHPDFHDNVIHQLRLHLLKIEELKSREPSPSFDPKVELDVEEAIEILVALRQRSK